MNLFALRKSVVLEQRLDMLPAGQSTDFADIRDIDDLGKTAARCIAENSSFH